MSLLKLLNNLQEARLIDNPEFQGIPQDVVEVVTSVMSICADKMYSWAKLTKAEVKALLTEYKNASDISANYEVYFLSGIKHFSSGDVVIGFFIAKHKENPLDSFIFYRTWLTTLAYDYKKPVASLQSAVPGPAIKLVIARAGKIEIPEERRSKTIRNWLLNKCKGIYKEYKDMTDIDWHKHVAALLPASKTYQNARVELKKSSPRGELLDVFATLYPSGYEGSFDITIRIEPDGTINLQDPDKAVKVYASVILNELPVLSSPDKSIKVETTKLQAPIKLYIRGSISSISKYNRNNLSPDALAKELISLAFSTAYRFMSRVLSDWKADKKILLWDDLTNDYQDSGYVRVEGNTVVVSFYKEDLLKKFVSALERQRKSWSFTYDEAYSEVIIKPTSKDFLAVFKYRSRSSFDYDNVPSALRKRVKLLLKKFITKGLGIKKAKLVLYD